MYESSTETYHSTRITLISPPDAPPSVRHETALAFAVEAVKATTLFIVSSESCSQPQGVHQSSGTTRTQNKLRALGHDDIRTPQMLVHLHPTEQEAGIQVEIHATQRVQFEITVDPTNLVSRQPGMS